MLSPYNQEFPQLTKNEIFPIPVGVEFGLEPRAVNLLYSPFTDKALLVTEDYIEKVEAYLTHADPDAEPAVVNAAKALTDYEHRKHPMPVNIDPLHYNRMAILPNNVCNFRCSYCYSAHGRSGKVLSKEILKSALDNFINGERIPTDKRLAISILGGGEPLLSWDLVTFIITYSKQRTAQQGFPGIDIVLVTNGSVITQEIADVLKANQVQVSVSFEILEGIQNLQRAHYKEVCEGIDLLTANGVVPQLRACITLDNIDLMKDMIDEVLRRFPKTKEVMMEYVTDPERLTTPEQVREFYKKYLDNFFIAHDFAAQHGILLDCSAYRNFNMLIERFCPGDNVLTAYGEISVCSRIGAPADDGYPDSIYGKVNEDGTVTIDYDKFRSLMNRNVYYYEKCNNCPAKWNCAGGCMIHQYAYNEEIREQICEYMRNFTTRMLLRNLDAQYRKQYGISLKQVVEQNVKKNS